MSDELNRFFDNAKRNLFPKVKSSTIGIVQIEEPTPKLCMELGALILFDKPILLVVPKGWRVPLALRTIANKIVDVDDIDSAESKARLGAAMREMLDASNFRSRPGATGDKHEG